MRAIIKFPLLILLCLLSAEAAFIRPAAAGQAPVALPDSSSGGLGDTFSPAENSTSGDASNRIYSGIANALSSLQQLGSVSSVDGQNLPISSAQLAQIEASLLGREGETSPQLTALGQQLSSGLGGKVVEISLLSNSPSNLAAAIESVNALIMSLNSEQLAAAAKSPTFIALLQLLNGGNDALSDDNSDRPSEAGDRELGILQMSLAR